MSLSNQPLAGQEQAKRAPLLLWCSSHTTLAAEEIPLLLEAGFRVIPLLTDFWTFEYNPDIDQRLCGDWKASVGLPMELVKQLQAIKFCADMGQNPFDPAELALLNEHVDVVYVAVLPNLAIRLAPLFKGTVIFRPFGHGHLNTYSRIAEHLNSDLDSIANCPNFMWAPILSTLQEPEDPRICSNANHLGAFVSPARLGPVRWSAKSSQPYVVETMPRIQKQPYYMELYKQYREDHGALPLKILGGNPVAGGSLNDPAIMGFLEDADYFKIAAQARVSIYHGTSPYHVHYHPIEFMALGVPVLFHQGSAFAAEGKRYGMTHSNLIEAGMVHSVAHANDMARAALEDASLAEALSMKQRVFLSEVFSRNKALEQARWIRSRTEQLRPWLAKNFVARPEVFRTAATPKCQRSMEGQPTSVNARKVKRPIPERVVREVKRVWRQALGSAQA